MFVSLNNLNEGGITESRREAKNKEFREGENPKSNLTKNDLSCWQSGKECSHVNANWQKLRK
jgi:hypothetical protein